jgi:hypothetical protein
MAMATQLWLISGTETETGILSFELTQAAPHWRVPVPHS